MTAHPILLTALLTFLPYAANAQDAPPTQGNDPFALATLRTANDHEIRFAELALSKQISAPTEHYAKRVDKQRSANQARTRGLATAWPPVDHPDLNALKARSAQTRATLASLDGPAFEQAWLEAVVSEQVDLLARLDERLIPATTEPAVRAHLLATREQLAAQLDEAMHLWKAATSPTTPNTPTVATESAPTTPAITEAAAVAEVTAPATRS
jgi:putative membrane protein